MLWPSDFKGLLVNRKTALGHPCLGEGNKAFFVNASVLPG